MDSIVWKFHHDRLLSTKSTVAISNAKFQTARAKGSFAPLLIIVRNVWRYVPRGVYEDRLWPFLGPDGRDDFESVLRWLRPAVKQGGHQGRSLRDFLDTLQQDRRQEEAAQEEEEAQGAANPTPLMNALNYNPKYANWEQVVGILDEDQDWEATLGWTWPATVPGPVGYSALHIAASKKDAQEEEEPGRRSAALQRMMAACIRRGVCINVCLERGNSMMHLAISYSNVVFLRALHSAELEVERDSRGVPEDYYPNWGIKDATGKTLLGLMVLKHGRSPPKWDNLQLLNFFRDRMDEAGWDEHRIARHERQQVEWGHTLNEVRREKAARARQAVKRARRAREAEVRSRSPARGKGSQGYSYPGADDRGKGPRGGQKGHAPWGGGDGGRGKDGRWNQRW